MWVRRETVKGGQAKAAAGRHLSPHSAPVSWGVEGCVWGGMVQAAVSGARPRAESNRLSISYLYLPGALLCPYNILNPCHTYTTRRGQMAANGDVFKLE